MLIANDVRKIKRVALTHSDDVEAELRGDVLTRAHKEFGYVGDSFGARGPLAKALVGLDIHPLDAAMVEQYKKSKERKGGDIADKWHCLAWAAWIGIVGIVWAKNYSPRGDMSDYIFAGFMTLAITCLVMVLFWHGIAANELLPSYRKSWGWKSFGLGRTATGFTSYRGYIPVHVLNTALEIRTACPGIAMVIDELTLSIENIERPLPDPFLKATLGSESYYIAVWDEREFEARM